MPLRPNNFDAPPVAGGARPLRRDIADLGTPSAPVQETIGDLFREQARLRGSALAVSDGVCSWSYAELDGRSDAIANSVLAQIGEEPALVALLMDHRCPAIAAIMGVIKSGHAFIALDPKHPPAWVRGQLVHLEAAMVLATPDRLGAVRDLVPPNVRVDAVDQAAPCAGGVAPPFPRVDPDTPACIISTSGSTGEPKGVIKTHAGLLHSARHYIGAAGVTPEDRFSLLAPVGFMASIPPMLSAFLTGAALFPFVVAEHGIDALIDWIASERITVYDSVPTLFRQVARAVNDRQRLSSVRLVRLGGETVRPSDLRLLRKALPRPASLQVFLGSSEASMISQIVIGPEDPIPEGLMPLGRPVDGIEVAFVDEAGVEVERGQAGRMVVRGKAVSPGYWRNPAATASSFRSEPHDPSTRTYQTSDFGRWRPDGMLEHLGRTEEFAKVRGTRVSPAVAESALAELEGVRDVAVVARSDNASDERLVAYIVPHPGSRLNVGGLREMLRGRIPASMAPAAYVLLDAMPLTANGKVDRKALPAPLTPPRPIWRRPRDAIECEIARAWEEILGAERVGLDDSFTGLGGTSLDAVRLLLRLEQFTSRRLQDSIMADHDRLEDLAAAVARQELAPGPLVPHKVSGSKRPFFCVHPVKGTAGIYGPLSRAIDPDRPFYAFQSPGLSGSWPLASIAAMAERYTQEVRRIDPNGPYLLGGLCAGGLVAWEMARLLRSAGAPVALVVLIETWRRSFGRTDGPAGTLRFEARHAARVARWGWQLGLARARGRDLPPSTWPAWRQFVNYMNEAATRRYRPSRYSGRLAILIADGETPDGPIDERLAMQDYADGPVVVASVPGTHATVCDGSHIGTIAGVLRDLLDDAEGD